MAWRLIFALVVLYKWYIYKIDMISAFIQSDIDINTLYICLPEGVDYYANKLLLLWKALYSLKQSARLQFITLKEVLVNKFGFKLILSENCILVNKELKIIICIYVDDLALISPDMSTIKSLIEELKHFFKLKDLGLIKDYLGIEIDYNRDQGYMKLY